MQDAVPITIGQEFEAYGASIRRSIDDLKFVGENILELNVGKNAIGTGINTHPEFTLKTCEYLKEINGFEWRVNPDAIYGTQYHTIFLKVSNALRMLAVNVNKIVSDLIILSSGPRTGINELILPPVEPGSSIMPGKVNPNVAEMMKMICFQVFGNDTVINFAANAGQLELNYMAPLESKNLIESLDILTNGIKTFDEICVSGIKVNEKVNRFNFENSAGLATLLNPYIGYDNAAEIVNESLESGKSIPELVIEKGLMDKEKLDKILSENVTKPNM